jgi:hypothetical protein
LGKSRPDDHQFLSLSAAGITSCGRKAGSTFSQTGAEA